MNVSINTKITVLKAVRRKNIGYIITVEKKAPEYLTITARSENGKGRGVVGRIDKDGLLNISKDHADILYPLLNAENMKNRIEIVLELVYGKDGKRKLNFNKKGLIDISKKNR